MQKYLWPGLLGLVACLPPLEIKPPNENDQPAAMQENNGGSPAATGSTGPTGMSGPSGPTGPELAPTAALTGLPANPSNQTATMITVSGTNVAQYRYRLDSGTLSADTPTSQTIALTGLSNGLHTLEVVGGTVNGTFAALASATRFDWTVDTLPPAFTLAGLPPSLDSNPTPTVTVVSADVVLYDWTIACSSIAQDGMQNVPVATAIAPMSLDDGACVLTVIGYDAALNSTTRTHSWTLDSTLPQTTLVSGAPSNPTQATNITIDVNGVNAVDYLYSLDCATSSVDVSNQVKSFSQDITASSISDGECTLTVTARNALGTLDPSPLVILWVVNSLPTITLQPSASQTIVEGNAFSITTAATGSGVISYEWRKDTAANGITGPTFAIASVVPADSGTYSALAINTLAATTSERATNNAVLVVNALPVITSAPTGATLVAGTSTTLDVGVAAASGSLGFVWLKDGTPLGATGPTSALVLSNVDTVNAGSYVVRIDRTLNGTHAITTSTPVTIAVNKVTITAQPVGLTLFENSSSSFQVTAAAPSGATVSYQWRLGASLIGTNSETLVLTSVTAGQVGDYVVDVTSTLNSVSTTRTSNPAPLSIVTNAPANPTASGTTNMNLSATALRTQYNYVVACSGPTGFTGTNNANDSLDLANLPDGDCSVDIAAKGPSGTDAPAHYAWTIDRAIPVITCGNINGPLRESDRLMLFFDRRVGQLYNIDASFGPTGFSGSIASDGRSATLAPSSGLFPIGTQTEVNVQALSLTSFPSALTTCRFDVVPQASDVLYVSATGATGSSSCNDKLAPCELGFALDIAAARAAPAVVLNVAGGTHVWPGASALSGPVSLYGGFDSGFATRAPSTHQTTLTSTTALAGYVRATMRCANTPPSSVLDGFFIEQPSNAGMADKTASIALDSGCNTTVRNNTIYPTIPSIWAGVYIFGGMASTTQPTIRGNTFLDDAGSFRVAITDFTSGLSNYAAPSIVGNEIFFDAGVNSRSGIGLIDMASAQLTSIRSNNIRVRGAFSSGVSFVGTSTSLAIENNNIEQNNYTGLSVNTTGSHVMIEGNTVSVETAPADAVVIYGSNSTGDDTLCTIQQNRIYGADAGLVMNLTGDALIRNNLLASEKVGVAFNQAVAGYHVDFNTIASRGTGVYSNSNSYFLDNVIAAPAGASGSTGFVSVRASEALVANDLFHFDVVFEDQTGTLACATLGVCTIAEIATMSGSLANVSADPDLPQLAGTDGLLSTWNDNRFDPGPSVSCQVAYAGGLQTSSPPPRALVDFGGTDRSTGSTGCGGDGLSMGAYELP